MCAVQCNHVQWLILIDGNCEMNSSSFSRKMSVRCQRRPNDVHFLFLWIFRVHVSFSGPWFSISLLFIILMKKKTATISVNEQLNANARGGKPIWKCNIVYEPIYVCVSAPSEISHVRKMQFRLFAVWYSFVISVRMPFVLQSNCGCCCCLSVPFDSYLSYYRTHFIHYMLIYALCKHRRQKRKISKCTHARSRSSNQR